MLDPINPDRLPATSSSAIDLRDHYADQVARLEAAEPGALAAQSQVIADARRENTQRAYASAQSAFLAYCSRSWLPADLREDLALDPNVAAPETVLGYIHLRAEPPVVTTTTTRCKWLVRDSKGERIETKRAALKKGSKSLPIAVDCHGFAVILYPPHAGAAGTEDATVEPITAPLRYSSLSLHLAALRAFYRDNGLPDPTSAPMVKSFMAGLRTRHGAVKRQKKPIVTRSLDLLLDALDRETEEADDWRKLIAIRDRAIISFGYGRRSAEVAGLLIEDLAFHEATDGMLIEDIEFRENADGNLVGMGHLESGPYMTALLRSTKTDKNNAGVTVAVPDMGKGGTVYHLRKWLEVLSADGINSGPVFRRVMRQGTIGTQALTTRSLRSMLKTRAAKVGIAGDVSFHSLRSGFVTASIRAGVPLPIISATTKQAPATIVGYFDREALSSLDNEVLKRKRK